MDDSWSVVQPTRRYRKELSRRAGLKRHLSWLQRTAMGDVLITFLPDVHGIPPDRATAGSPPELVFAWEAPAGE